MAGHNLHIVRRCSLRGTLMTRTLSPSDQTLTQEGVDIMLNKVAFASALALLTGALYLVLYVLAVLMPTVFRFIFNAQFLGADLREVENVVDQRQQVLDGGVN